MAPGEHAAIAPYKCRGSSTCALLANGVCCRSSSNSTEINMALKLALGTSSPSKSIDEPVALAGMNVLELAKRQRTALPWPDIIHTRTLPSTLPIPSELVRCSYFILSCRAVSLHQNVCSGWPRPTSFRAFSDDSWVGEPGALLFCASPSTSRIAVCIAVDWSVEKSSIVWPRCRTPEISSLELSPPSSPPAMDFLRVMVGDFLLALLAPSLSSDGGFRSDKYPFACTPYLSPRRKEHRSTVLGSEMANAQGAPNSSRVLARTTYLT